jgi:hypothetical protein
VAILAAMSIGPSLHSGANDAQLRPAGRPPIACQEGPMTPVRGLRPAVPRALAARKVADAEPEIEPLAVAAATRL